MGSAFAWMDYDARTRRDLLKVVSELGSRKGGDPMSVGVVRDAVAEQLFPGTSTNHTRARYLVLIPAVLSSRPPMDEAEVPAREQLLTRRLVETPANASSNEWGVIGRENPFRRLTPLYWGALGKWGYYSTDQEDGASVAGALQANPLTRRTSEPDGDVPHQPPLVWHSDLVPLIDAALDRGRIPAAPSIACDDEEKRFVRDRLVEQKDLQGRDTVLSYLAACPHSPRAWPSRTGECLRGRRAPNHLRHQIERAQQVGTVLHGLQLAYHLALYRKARYRNHASWASAKSELENDIDRVKSTAADWASRVEGGSISDDLCERAAWHGITSSPAAQSDVLCQASALVCDANLDLDGPAWRNLVTMAQRRLGVANRLDHDRDFERWNGRPEMVDGFDFRWRAARQLLREVTA